MTETTPLLVVPPLRCLPLTKGWRCVVGGFLIHLVLGTLYVWANTTSYVTSYLRRFDPSLTYNDTLMVYATALGMQGCTMLLGGILERRLGSRATAMMGGYLIVLGTFLSAFAESLPALLLTDGVLFGSGLGIAYSAPIVSSVKWLPHRKGLVTGVIVSGFGGGAFVFGFIATRVVNPEQVSIRQSGSTDRYFSPESEVTSRVPLMFMVLSICYFVCVTVGGMLISEPTPLEQQQALSTLPFYQKVDPDVETNELEDLPGDPILTTITSTGVELTQLQDGKVTMSSSCDHPRESAKPLGDDDSANVTPAALVWMPIAWHLSSCFITTTVGGMYLAGTFKTYGAMSFSSEVFLSTLSSTASIFNAAGRIFWGAVADRVGLVETLMVMSLLFSLTIATYAYSPLLGPAGFSVWTLAIFFFEGSNFALYPPLTISLFGSKHSGANYGIIFTLYAVCVVTNITLLAGHDASFHTATTAMGALTFAGFVNLCLLSRHIQAFTKRKVLTGCKYT